MTQAARIYEHLKQKGTITNAQSHNLYGIRHLPAIIRDIKKLYGAKISDDTQKGKNRFGEHCWWKVYRLEENEPQTA